MFITRQHVDIYRNLVVFIFVIDITQNCKAIILNLTDQGD